jgi:hypothetical protein
MYRDSTLQSMSPVEKCANFRFEFLECRPDHAEFHPVGDFVLERLTEDRADHSLSPCSVRDVVIVDGEVLREEGVAKGAFEAPDSIDTHNQEVADHFLCGVNS